MTTPGL